MSRRGGDYDRYDDRRSEVSRRPRTERNYEELDVDYRSSRNDGPAPSRYDPPPSRRAETMVKEKESDTVMTQGHRTERTGPRQPDFLREDYGRNQNAGQLVVREEREEDDYVSRAPRRRRSMESTRSGPPPQRTERVEQEEFILRERERDYGGPPYPRSEVGEREDVIYRERTRSRPPPSNRGGGTREEIDIRIREEDRQDYRPPAREVYREDDVRSRRGGPPPAEFEKEEITFTREERNRPPPPREDISREVSREEVTFRETRSPPPREYRGRETRREEEIDINIRDRSAPPPRQRSMSRGALVRRDHEEWIVRRPRTPSPSPPPPREIEKEQIIIRRRERTPSPEPEPPREPSPEPPREPSPEPLPLPEPPIYRPPIIQEVITHHRHIDHGIERVRSPTPPPAPAPPPPAPAPRPPPPEPPKEEDLEISIRRQGTRNGKTYDEEITFEQDRTERQGRDLRRTASRDVSRDVTRQRSVSRRRYDDDVGGDSSYYNRQVASRAYPGEAWNGATKDWALVDLPPGTERVRMDGAGGGRQDITWDRYNGMRRGQFSTRDQVFDEGYGNGAPAPPALAPPGDFRETRITERRTVEESSTPRRRPKEKMWTEVTKDLVIREAIEEKGYEFEETEEFFYVLEYLRYEDVLKLVEITEDIRRQRRERLREIQWQREEGERTKALPPPPPRIPPPPHIPPPPIRGGYDEKIVERDYYYDREGRRYR